MTDTTIFVDDINHLYEEAQELMPNVVAIGGNDYQCWPARPAVELAPDLDGDPLNISVSLKVKAADFTTAPAEGALAKYKTKTYRIVRVEEAADGLQYTLALGNERK